MKKLSCPKCGGELETITYEEIAIDRCCRCAGIWFDPLEVEKLKNIKGSESLDLGSPDLESHLDRVEKPIKCPRCQCKMTPMLDIDRHTIWYEKCPQCEGIWLDSGEFKRYKQNFPSGGVMNQVKQIFEPKSLG
jgi:Zn-finger nucleic acid-binding protein